MTIEIVDLPTQMMIFHSYYVSLPEGNPSRDFELTSIGTNKISRIKPL
jgi:hypothetical protein